MIVVSRVDILFSVFERKWLLFLRLDVGCGVFLVAFIELRKKSSTPRWLRVFQGSPGYLPLNPFICSIK